jgi:hypothetical protein
MAALRTRMKQAVTMGAKLHKTVVSHSCRIFHVPNFVKSYPHFSTKLPKRMQVENTMALSCLASMQKGVVCHHLGKKKELHSVKVLARCKPLLCEATVG